LSSGKIGRKKLEKNISSLFFPVKMNAIFWIGYNKTKKERSLFSLPYEAISEQKAFLLF